MENVKILIAEDNDLSRENLAELLSGSGYEVKAVADGKEAIEALGEERYHLIITDLKMPRVDGLELLRYVKEKDPGHLVIMTTGYGTVNTAVDAMKLGAFDYITKPLRDDLVKITVARALSFVQLQQENVVLKDHLREKLDFGKMIGYSDPMKRVFDTIAKVSSSDSTVLIYGESGTGKELVAKAIHFNSERRNQPLVAVNCGAIPEELLESELFGHEKGSFTGAIRTKIGRFEMAQGGTIFLDEIGDMSPSLQVKLLRVIQERNFERIGGLKTISVDVRIIAATNQNLEKAVAEKKFREDLFYRINVIPINLPPLRERDGDIEILADHFLRRFSQQNRKNIARISPEAMRRIMGYGWPGNVRELENLLEMLVVLKEAGDIGVEDLPPKLLPQAREDGRPGRLAMPPEGLNFNDVVSRFERDLLLQALEKSRGVKNRAAKLLQLNRTTLVEKLKRFDIADQDPAVDGEA
jgi:DNA-binding NtrC family response regulator